MKEGRQVFYLSAVKKKKKLGRKKASVLQVRVYFQSHASLRLLDLTREIVRPRKRQKHDTLFV